MNWIQQAKKEAQEMQKYINQLEARNKELVGELTDIAVGFTLTSQPESWSFSAKLQDRAGRLLKKHATAPLMERPTSRWW